MSDGPDRPRAEPEDRVVYLPVKVTYEGLYDPKNGPYFKGSVQVSPAQAPTTISISESQVLNENEIEAKAIKKVVEYLEAGAPTAAKWVRNEFGVTKYE